MKFKIAESANGTCLQGYITAGYDELVEKFGPPLYGPDFQGDKVTCEWCLEFEDGTVATIYDWKVRSTPMYNRYNWHIGGNSVDAVNRVHDTFFGMGDVE